MGESVVYQGQSALIGLAFYNAEGVATQPTSGTYTLRDKLTGAVINSRLNTALVITGTSLDLLLTAADNAIVTAGLKREVHTLEVTVDFAGGVIGKDPYDIPVLALG